MDIAEFAPLSVKSKGDFADILAEDNPDIWHSNRPAKGGETGAMFEKIIARALEMRGAAGAAGSQVAEGFTELVRGRPASRRRRQACCREGDEANGGEEEDRDETEDTHFRLKAEAARTVVASGFSRKLEGRMNLPTRSTARTTSSSRV